MATLDFNRTEKRITILSPSTEVTIQELYDKSKDKEDDTGFIDSEIIMTASGKESLGGGVFVGITAVMQNGWKIGFEARTGPATIPVVVSGGNLVDSSGTVGAQFFATPFTQIQYASASTSTFIQQQAVEDLKFTIESLRPSHSSYGKMIYWDQSNGSDLNDGLSEGSSVESFVKAHALVTSGKHDIILVMPTSTTITDNLVITKDWVSVRFPGKRVQLKPSEGIAIDIQGEGVEISKAYFDGSSTSGTSPTIKTTGNNSLIKDCFISNSPSNGVESTGTDNVEIINTSILNATHNGVLLNDVRFLKSDNLYIYDSGINGVEITATLPSASLSNKFKETMIQSSTRTNMVLGTNVTSTFIENTTHIGNDANRLTDNGTTTIDNDTTVKIIDIHEVETGTWKIVGTQMIFFKQDGITEIFRRELKDSGGNPSNENVFEGIRI